jgi:hypothetical protein
MRLTTTSTLLLTIVACATTARQPAVLSTAAGARITWGSAPTALPRDARTAAVQGEPGAAASLTVRLRLPDGFRVAPHARPSDEVLTVVSATLRISVRGTPEAKGTLTLHRERPASG